LSRFTAIQVTQLLLNSPNLDLEPDAAGQPPWQPWYAVENAPTHITVKTQGAPGSARSDAYRTHVGLLSHEEILQYNP
jgi:hypothetical protein